MHCFYLSLFNRHAVHVWGMDATKDDSDSVIHKLKAPRDGAAQAMASFQASDLPVLARSSWNALAFVCARLNISCDGTKEDLLLQLVRATVTETSQVTPELKNKRECNKSLLGVNLRELDRVFYKFLPTLYT
ncbi:hypothetical protein AGABI1DRAFT_134855 [Agaricus bisporus var. burnettii JB137-S8]|uniref:Uncharacterized protein n=1 Tax=Agaricus bisporus var. burnettii (strain JB137-S8 / ATCC MYA-4627 / FGSC 10392) TaxID=597362 RepID=K5WS77_AGABU|nr:uncharacterized protein AGABI1DRAFT_134855 [Agaricus bisporus var. burnettii JB137-S8]EKM73397.1 hypothetical protein AGABI1DRAFT_134855 [Agaricus bisporus var. burnettii JB137-S8]